MELQRPPRSSSEIASLPPEGTTERTAFVQAHADDFCPETLVYLLRETAARGDTATFERCARALAGTPDADGRCTGGHCEGIIIAMAARWHFHQDHQSLRLFRYRCHGSLWRAVRAGSARKHFWEERFGRALKHLCIDEARRLAGELRTERGDAVSMVELDEQQIGAGDDPKALDEEVWGRIVQDTLLAAVRRLPPQQGRAAFLVLIERRPVESVNPGSAAAVLGVTGREVHNLLAKAKVRLAADPEIRKFLENS